jgi:hypothetical protein
LDWADRINVIQLLSTVGLCRQSKIQNPKSKISTDRRRFQRPAAAEDRQPRQQPLLALRQG